MTQSYRDFKEPYTDDVEEVRNKNDIVEVVSQYVKLKKSGKRFKGLCPFHPEKRPSFMIDPQKQLFHCFGCEAGGDIYTFLMKIENIDFPEALQILADRAGYTLRRDKSGIPTSERKRIKERLYKLHKLAKEFYVKNLYLKDAAHVRNYLGSRGFRSKVIKKFELGYSPYRWDGFTNYAIKSGFTVNDLLQSGLAVQSSKYRRGCYDLFRDRLMFPIFDLTGKVIAFGGRTLKDETPKYINSPETMIYKKKKIVYAIDKAKEDIVKEDKVIVVEGYTDILALNQEGIRNCVASLGTALTIEQIRLLNRFTNNIITVFDADAAGEAATERSIDLLKEYNGNMELYREHNVNISAVTLPLGYDPAKFIMEKKDENIINLINKAEPLIDFTLKLLLERSDSSTISGKLKAAYDLVNFISDIPSRLDQEEYIKAIAQKIDITEEQLFSYLSDVHRKKKVKPSVAKRRAYYPKEKVEIDETKITPQSSIELEAISFIINSEGEPRELLLELEKNDFKYQPAREIFTLLKRGIINKKANKIYKLGNDLTSETSKKLFNKLQFEEKIYDNPHRISQEIYCRIKEFELKRRKSNTLSEMSKYDSESKKYDELFKKLLNIEAKIRDLKEGKINI
ncbi:MAG: DNA primase [Actinomycetia bacterium]|nr:DNA primase [Actinomycetes bacterium]